MRYISFLILLFVVTSACAKTKTDKNSVTYKVDDSSYQGYYLSAGKDAPLVLLVHDWDGLTDYEIKRSKMLVGLGYSVFAVDLFGENVRPIEVEDKRKHTGELFKDRKKMRSLMYGALNAAKAKGANTANAVAMGYCFGGAAVLELARDGADLKGFATFHGGLATPEGQDYAKTRGEILIMHGSADKSVSLETFAQVAEELKMAEAEHEMIVYGDAEHAFTVYGGKRYNKAADEQSWARFTAFLDKKLK